MRRDAYAERGIVAALVRRVNTAPAAFSCCPQPDARSRPTRRSSMQRTHTVTNSRPKETRARRPVGANKSDQRPRLRQSSFFTTSAGAAPAARASSTTLQDKDRLPHLHISSVPSVARLLRSLASSLSAAAARAPSFALQPSCWPVIHCRRRPLLLLRRRRRLLLLLLLHIPNPCLLALRSLARTVRPSTWPTPSGRSLALSRARLFYRLPLLFSSIPLLSSFPTFPSLLHCPPPSRLLACFALQLFPPQSC